MFGFVICLNPRFKQLRYNLVCILSEIRDGDHLDHYYLFSFFKRVFFFFFFFCGGGGGGGVA